jgi:MFS family permease
MMQSEQCSATALDELRIPPSVPARFPKTWATVWTLALCAAAPALLVSLVVPVLPQLPGQLDVSVGDASWIITATLLSSIVTMPILARMADTYGRRRVMIGSLLCLVAGSLPAACGGSFAWVLAGRALQGVASAIVPISFAVAKDVVVPARVNSAIALMSGAMGVGLALGMPLAGVITAGLGWQSILWVPGAVAAALMVAILLTVAPDAKRGRGAFDVVGATVLAVTLTALLVAISYGPTWGWTSRSVLLLLLVSLVGAVIWVPIQLGAPVPMIDLRVTCARPVLLNNLASILVAFGVMTNMIVTAMQLTAPEATGYGFGLSAFDAGLIMLPFGLAMVVIAPIAGLLLTRWGGYRVLALGCLAVGVVFALRVVVDVSLLAVIITTSVIGMGLGLTFAATPALILDSVPLSEAASANGVNNVLRALASTIASAILAAIVTSMTVRIAGQDHLSESGLDLCFWISAVLALVAAALAALVVPRGER